MRRHPTNPRYLAGRDGRPVVLVGSHTWANFASDPGEAALDYPAYLDFLERHGHNAFRGWVWDVPWSRQGWNGGPFRWTPSPWERTGPGLATDGLPRFDLTTFHEPYFDRLRERAALAGERGIHVAVMLFQGYAWQLDRTADDGFPYDGRNNVNGVDCGPDGGAASLRSPAVVAAQEAYVRRVVEAVGDLDTVLLEIANEAPPGSTAWQHHHVRHLRSLGVDAPVGMTFQYEGGTLDALTSSGADWVSPDCDPAVRADPPAADGRQVVVLDTDHGYDWRTLRGESPDAHRSWVWRALLRGNHVLFMDPYLARIEIDGETRNAPVGVDPRDDRFGLAPDPFWDPLRAAMGHARRVLDRVDLAHAVPAGELCSTGYCLAAPGREYLAFAGAAQELALDLAPGTYDVTWIDPGSAAEHAGHPVIGGGRRILRTAHPTAAVVHLRRRPEGER